MFLKSKQNITEKTNGLLYKLSLGRTYFIKQMISNLVLNYLGGIAKQQIEQDSFQVATFAFDHIGHHINLKGVYEREELEAVFGYLSNNNLIKGNALDIGANKGNHSLYFSRYYNNVYSFEPNPRTFQLLKMNASLVSNIECINIGLSDSERVAMLATNPANVGASSLGLGFEGDFVFQQEINLRTLDSFEGGHFHEIGLIKIDVEGHELAVLKGAKQLINKNRPTILFEQHLSDFKKGKSPTVEYLRALGYKKFASVKPAPGIPLWVPNFVRKPLIFALRSVFGLSYNVVQQDTLPPTFYAFIIAIP